jgi:hypothetical protein
MLMFWLTCHRNNRPVGVVIVEAASVIHARMRASLEGLANGLAFEKSLMIPVDIADHVPSECVGRMLSVKEANDLLDRIEHERRGSKKSRTQ